MTFRQKQFCIFIVKGLSAQAAAIKAGYSEATAYTNSARLLAVPCVQARIIRLRNHSLVSTTDLFRYKQRLEDLANIETESKLLIKIFNQLISLQKITLLPPDDEFSFQQIANGFAIPIADSLATGTQPLTYAPTPPTQYEEMSEDKKSEFDKISTQPPVNMYSVIITEDEPHGMVLQPGNFCHQPRPPKIF